MANAQKGCPKTEDTFIAESKKEKLIEMIPPKEDDWNVELIWIHSKID